MSYLPPSTPPRPTWWYSSFGSWASPIAIRLVNVDTKSSGPDEGMTIGELAGRFGLATHVLRHWETIGLLAPARRANGRRRYGEADLTRVALVLRGKEAGFSLEHMREVLAAPDPSTRRALLERHHAELERRIAEAQASKEMIEHALDCPSEDFLDCPYFKQMVAARIPGSAAESPLS